MIATTALARAVEEGLALLAPEPEVSEVEVFASANCALLARLAYASHVPSNGVEEPKSTEGHGVGIRVVLDRPDGRRVGFGAEPGDLSRPGIARAFARARQAAVPDHEFRSLPRPGPPLPARAAYHDPEVSIITDERLVEAGWAVLRGALGAFLASSPLAALAGSEAALARLGLIVGGDVTILHERMAVGSSHLPVRVDESTLVTGLVTAMVETRAAKGTATLAGTRLVELTEDLGAEAAARAMAAVDGERVPTGEYTVVFGRQPVADILSNVLLPACRAGAFYTRSSPFLGRLGRAVAAPGLSLHDDGARPGHAGTKAFTCEGLPTGRTDLIRDGVLVGLLADWYEAERLRHDPAIADKLGVEAGAAGSALVPRNGFRFAEGGGRAFDRPPATAGSNVFLEGTDPVPPRTLIAGVGDGLYVGRIWYTYNVNGLRAGDFTCTVVGDSFIIRGGRLVAPLRANAVRISDNIHRLLHHVVGIADRVEPTVLWAADEVIHAPEIAVAGVRVDAIAGAMEASD